MTDTDQKPSAAPHLFTKENAAEKGRIGGLAAAEKRRLRREEPETFVALTLEESRPQLVKALLDAALARGEWDLLPLEKRLSAVVKALEYAVGKPTAAEKETSEKAEEVGLTIS